MLPPLPWLKHGNRATNGAAHIERMKFLFMVFQSIKNKNLNKEDLLIRDNGRIIGHEDKLMKRRCRKDVMRFNFQNRTINTWNSMEVEVIRVKNINKFKVQVHKEIWRQENMSLAQILYNTTK